MNRRYFRQAYLSGRHGWGSEEPSSYVAEYLRHICRVAGAGKLLDLGCGEGRHCFLARGLGFDVTGVDFEPLALKRARRFARPKGIRGVTFRFADVLNLPFREGSFDVVIDCGCLHHQRKADWKRYKRGLLRVLRPGGHYVLSVFSRHFHMFRGSRRSWHIRDGAYRRCFRREEVIGLFGGDFVLIRMREERDGGRGFWHALSRRLPASSG